MTAGGWDTEVGPFWPIVDRAKARGVAVTFPGRNPWGNPPETALGAPIDRGDLEAAFDLGPLVRWLQPRLGEWTLIDLWSRASIVGTGASAPPLGHRRAPDADRPRIGWVEDAPRRPGPAWAPVLEGEPARLAGADLREPPPGVALRRHLVRVRPGVDPEQARARFVEATQVVAEAWAGAADTAAAVAACPPWLHAVAPVRDDAAWVAHFARHPIEAARRTEHDIRFASVSLAEWVVSMRPDQRLWSWWSGRVTGADELEVSVVAPSPPAPSASYKWLAHAAGALECERR